MLKCTLIFSRCAKNIEYLAKLQSDYNLKDGQDQLQALGIMSQLLLRPWMNRFLSQRKEILFLHGSLLTGIHSVINM